LVATNLARKKGAMQRIVFILPGDMLHTASVPMTDSAHDFQRALGRTMGRLRATLVPSLGMTRMKLFADPAVRVPIDLADAYRASPLYVQTGVRGVGPSSHDELLFVPKIELTSDDIPLEPTKNACVRIDSSSVRSMGFVDSLLHVLCPLSGLCHDEIQTVLHPDMVHALEQPTTELFDPDRLVNASNTVGALKVVSKRPAVLASSAVHRSVPLRVSASAGRAASQSIRASLVTSSPKRIQVEFPGRTDFVSDAKLSLQVALGESGVDVKDVTDAVVRVGSTDVSLFNGSDAFEESRGVDSKKLIASAQKRGITLIV
jgi:hypothetical protein